MILESIHLGSCCNCVEECIETWSPNAFTMQLLTFAVFLDLLVPKPCWRRSGWCYLMSPNRHPQGSLSCYIRTSPWYSFQHAVSGNSISPRSSCNRNIYNRNIQIIQINCKLLYKHHRTLQGLFATWKLCHCKSFSEAIHGFIRIYV